MQMGAVAALCLPCGSFLLRDRPADDLGTGSACAGKENGRPLPSEAKLRKELAGRQSRNRETRKVQIAAGRMPIRT